LTEGYRIVFLVSALAVGAAVMSGVAYLRVVKMLKEQQARWNRRQQAMQSELGVLRSQMAELQAGLADSQTRGSAPAPGSMSGLNLNRRVQAIRLSRRGDSPGAIAAALGVPQGEVELLLKVRQMASQTA
jgi:hypothetical protein